MAKRRPNPLKGIPVTGKPRKGRKPADSFLSAAMAFLETLLNPPRSTPMYLCMACGCRFLVLGLPEYCPMCRQPFKVVRPQGVPKPLVPKMSRIEASAFLWAHSGVRSNDHYRKEQVLREAYRRAAFKLHTDNKATGNHELFVKLQEAMEVLENT
jgi:hypothetical protein